MFFLKLRFYSKYLHDFDPFRYLKEQAFVSSLSAITVLGNHLTEILANEQSLKEATLLKTFISDFLQVKNVIFIA